MLGARRKKIIKNYCNLKIEKRYNCPDGYYFLIIDNRKFSLINYRITMATMPYKPTRDYFTSLGFEAMDRETDECYRGKDMSELLKNIGYVF